MVRKKEVGLRKKNARKRNLKTSYACAATELNSSVLWVITWCEVVCNRRFGITYRSHLQGSPHAT